MNTILCVYWWKAVIINLVSLLLHPVWQSPSPSMCLQMALFCSLLWLSSILWYICTTLSFSISFFVDGHSFRKFDIQEKTVFSSRWFYARDRNQSPTNLNPGGMTWFTAGHDGSYCTQAPNHHHNPVSFPGIPALFTQICFPSGKQP